MRTPEEIRAVRAKMLEHLEAALALADETKSSTAGYLIETAMGQIRDDYWPDFNTHFDTRK